MYFFSSRFYTSSCVNFDKLHVLSICHFIYVYNLLASAHSQYSLIISPLQNLSDGPPFIPHTGNFKCLSFLHCSWVFVNIISPLKTCLYFLIVLLFAFYFIDFHFVIPFILIMLGLICSFSGFSRWTLGLRPTLVFYCKCSRVLSRGMVPRALRLRRQSKTQP